MHLPDHETATPVLPPFKPQGTPGYFSEGDAALGQPFTIFDQDIGNAMVLELANAITGSGQPLTKGDNTQLLKAILMLSGGLDDSWLDNGGMKIVNRLSEAVTPTALSTKAFSSIDRWMIDPGDGRARLIPVGVTQIGASGGATMPEWVRSYCGFGPETTAATSDPCKLLQRFLPGNVQALSGKSVCASFWGKLADASAASSRNVTIRLRIHFGTGGSPSADITLTGTAHAVLKSTWARYFTTFTVPNMDNMTLGTGAWSYAEMQLRLDTSHPVSSGAELILATGVKLQPGTTPTQFVYPREADEVDRCLRFYESSLGGESLAGAGQKSASRGYESMGDNLAQTLATHFRVPKAFPVALYPTAPVIKWYSPTTQAVDTIDAGGAQLAVSGNNHLSHMATGYPTTTGGSGTVDVAAHFAADFEIR